MIKVGLTTSVIQRGKTGIAQWMFALTKALERHTDQLQLTLFVLEDDLPLFKYAESFCQIQIVPEPVRPPVKDILWHQKTLPTEAKRLGLDLLHLPSYRRLIRTKHCATLGTIHDLAPFHLSGKYDWKRMLYGKHVVPFFARGTNRLTAVSHYTAQDITRFFGIPQDRISVIHNGLDHERFQPTSDETVQQEVLDRHNLKRPFFLYVARIEHPGKNHVRLIDAYDRFKKATDSTWQLVFGGSDWHGAEHVHQRIAASPFANDIKATGFVPDDDLPHLYRAANAFLYPSLFEGFGMPPVEAMACGSPVISSASGSLEEVIGKAGIIIDPESVPEIEEALSEMATNETLRSELRVQGLQNAQRFRWENAAELTVQEYHRAIKEFHSHS